MASKIDKPPSYAPPPPPTEMTVTETSKTVTEVKGIKEVKEITKTVTEVKEIKDVKKINEVKDPKEVKKADEIKEIKKAIEVKEIKDIKKATEVKEIKEVKKPNDVKENKEIQKAQEVKDVEKIKETIPEVIVEPPTPTKPQPPPVASKPNNHYYSSDEDSISSDSDDDDAAPPPPIKIERGSDLSSMKSAFTEPKPDDSPKEKQVIIEGLDREKFAIMKSAIQSKPDEEFKQERENLTVVDREKYASFKNKFEHIDEEIEKLKQKRKSEAEITSVGKEKLGEAKNRFEKGEEEFVVQRPAVEIERSDADKKRIQKTFKKKQPSQDEGPKECAVCGKLVFPAEKMRLEKRVYHKLCFKCCKCQKILTVQNYTSYNGELYCKQDVMELYQPGKSGKDGVFLEGAEHVEQADEPDAELDEDEEYAKVNKPKTLNPNIVKSGLKSTDDIKNLPSLSSAKDRFEKGEGDDEVVIRRTEVEKDMFQEGGVKARLSKFVDGDVDDVESDEDDIPNKDPNIIRNSKKPKKDQMNFEVGSIKSKWEKGEADTPQYETDKHVYELEEIKKSGVSVKARFREKTGDEPEDDTPRKSILDQEHLDFTAAGSAREKFKKGPVTDEVHHDKPKEIINFKELGSFKEKFEKGQASEETDGPRPERVDVRCHELGNIKSSFEDGPKANETEKAEEKRMRLEREFKRYRKEKKMLTEKEIVESVGDEVSSKESLDDIRASADMGSIKDRFEKGPEEFTEDTAKLRASEVDYKVAGKAREKFKKIDGEAPKDGICPQPVKMESSSKWAKNKKDDAPEAINRRVNTEGTSDEDEGDFEVKNLLSKFKNIEKSDEKGKGPKPPRRVITPPPADYRSEVESDVADRDPNIVVSGTDEEKVRVRADPRVLLAKFEQGPEDLEEQEAEEKRKRIDEEFRVIREQKTSYVEQTKAEAQQEVPETPEEDETLNIAAEHARKSRAKWEKIQRKEAKKAEKEAQKSVGQRKPTQMSKFAKTPQPEFCLVCSSKVYATEKVECDGKFFHKMCFKCVGCGTSLRLETCAVGPDGLYCKKHYMELYNNMSKPIYNGWPRREAAPAQG